MKIVSSIISLLILTSGFTWSKAAGLSLPQALEEADLIAQIRVTADVLRVANTEKREPSNYTRLATAIVVSPIKGTKEGEVIKLNHSNGFVCPNVLYKVDQDYIVFLKRSSKNEHFDTMSYYAGQFRIEGGNVLGFYPLPDYNHSNESQFTVREVLSFLRNGVKKEKASVSKE